MRSEGVMAGSQGRDHEGAMQTPFPPPVWSYGTVVAVVVVVAAKWVVLQYRELQTKLGSSRMWNHKQWEK